LLIPSKVTCNYFSLLRNTLNISVNNSLNRILKYYLPYAYFKKWVFIFVGYFLYDITVATGCVERTAYKMVDTTEVVLKWFLLLKAQEAAT
jgi:hypothetical protein